jgi:hypothetical protein
MLRLPPRAVPPRWVAVTTELCYRHIPLRRPDVLEIVRRELRRGLGEGGDEVDASLDALYARLSALFHLRFHARLERMKRAFAPFDPDTGLRPFLSPSTDLSGRADELRAELERTLIAGNYQRLGRAEIEAAMRQQSLVPLQFSIDFDEFDELLLFGRGGGRKPVPVPRFFGLRTRYEPMLVWERVCLFVRMKPASKLTEKQRKRLEVEPGTTLLKLFRDIPDRDLEMLFPNCRSRMRVLDKLFLGIPAVAAGVPLLAKLAPLIAALGIAVGIARSSKVPPSVLPAVTGLLLLLAYLFRQWDKFRSRRVRFLKMRAENLYYRSLDNNEGVLTRLIDEAEEEECEEVLLAYGFLLTAPCPLSPEGLQTRLRDWFREHLDLHVELDVADAVRKLDELGLCSRDGEGRLSALPLDAAQRRLDEAWREQAELAPSPVPATSAAPSAAA